jgi:hypothetical protein
VVGWPPSLTSEDGQSFGAFEFRQLIVKLRADVAHLVIDLLPTQFQTRDDVLGNMMGMAGLAVWMMAFEDLSNPLGRVGHFRCNPSTYTKALSGVMARPTLCSKRIPLPPRSSRAYPTVSHWSFSRAEL